MIPADIKYNGNTTPPQWSDNADQVIEPGSHVRVKIVGIRNDMGDMRAIGKINEVSIMHVVKSTVTKTDNSVVGLPWVSEILYQETLKVTNTLPDRSTSEHADIPKWLRIGVET